MRALHVQTIRPAHRQLLRPDLPHQHPLRPTLQGLHDTDVLIIGAGFSGLHTALRLTQAGKRVTLLEASRVAWAASGRNGGQALLGWSCDMPPLEKALGIERTQRLWASMCWAAEELRELPQRHGFDIDYRLGSLWTAVMPRRLKMLEHARHEAEHKWGYDALRLIGRDELPEWIDSPRYQAALYDAKGAHLNPLKLAQGLASTVEAAGGASTNKARCSATTKLATAISPVPTAAKYAPTC